MQSCTHHKTFCLYCDDFKSWPPKCLTLLPLRSGVYVLSSLLWVGMYPLQVIEDGGHDAL